MKIKSVLAAFLSLTTLAIAACTSTGESSSLSQSGELSLQSQSLESSQEVVESMGEEFSNSESLEESSLESSIEESGEEDSSMEESSVEDSSFEESTEGESSSAEEEEERYYTVSFNTDGGTAVAPLSILEGGKIPQPEEPNKSTKDYEYIFLGWYYNGEKWDFEKDVVTGDMTLVAKWKEGEHYTNPFLPKD